MDQLFFLGSVFSALGLPAVALIALLSSKLAIGPAATRAQRRFLACLVVVTVVTAKTVTTNDATWLIHTVTLSMMIIGALWIPGQDVDWAGT